MEEAEHLSLQPKKKKNVLKAGWLYKKGRKRHSWKKRWFVIQPNLVTYYSDQSCSPKTLKGTLELRKSHCRVVLTGSASQNRSFGIICEDRTLDLKAVSLNEVAEWIKSFELAISGDGDHREISGSFMSKIERSTKQESKDAGKYERLVNFLTDPENRLLRRVIQKASQKKDEKALAIQLIHIFELRRSALFFLEELISESIRDCSKPHTLFRGNGITEKALTSYCHLVGTDYLIRSLKPLLHSVMNSDCEYEIDPAKVSGKSNVEANVVNLLSVSQMFVAKITSSKFTNVPYPIRLVCRQLAMSTKEKFPDGLHAVVGGLFFLRFVCPALTVPHETGIWPGELTPNAKRALLLISKTLMNLSNGVKFGNKVCLLLWNIHF